MSLQDYEDWIRRVYSDYSFTILIDTPAGYSSAGGYPLVVNNTETGLDYLSLSGQAEKLLRVKADESGIEFISLVLNFLVLTDTPGSYIGNGGLFAKVKADESGMEFASPGGFESGTKLMFKQASAPAGWTFIAEDNDRVILNTSTEADGGLTGGSWTISGFSFGVNNHTLSLSEIPSHNHGGGNHRHKIGSNSGYQASDVVININNIGYTSYYSDYSGTIINSNGGGGGHGHGFSSSHDSSWRPEYVKVITCQKD